MERKILEEYKDNADRCGPQELGRARFPAVVTFWILNGHAFRSAQVQECSVKELVLPLSSLATWMGTCSVRYGCKNAAWRTGVAVTAVISKDDDRAILIWLRGPVLI